MKRIFKYPLRVEHRQLQHMHSSAVPLWVCEQNMQLVLYAQVDADDTTVTQRIISVVTTGDEFEGDGAKFVGACTLGGWFQAFVFELTGTAQGAPIDRRRTEDFRQMKEEQILQAASGGARI